MSNFEQNEQTFSVFHATDSDSTKITTRNTNADFTIKLFPIKRGEDTISLMGVEVGDYVANVKASYPHADEIKRGDKITGNGYSFSVVNKPRYNILFKRYKLLLRSDK